MLGWVTLAKWPLAPGELDAMLRLKYANGKGVIYLEGKLRKPSASSFTLMRENNLTTADMQAPNRHMGEDDVALADVEPDEGLDDVENETDFNSNQKTTTVSFSHASISNFFRDGKYGKVTAPSGDHPAVGVDLTEAKVNIAQTCIDLHVDEILRARMTDTVGHTGYGKTYWLEHLAELDTEAASTERRITVGNSLARIIYEEMPIG